MSWIKQKLRKIFYKEPKGNGEPIFTTINKKKFDFESWSGLFADLSHWEEHFDVEAYDCPILINKCSDGISYIDSTHVPRKKACAIKGITYSGYHFYECDDDPIKQANFYIITHGAFEVNPILDYETNGSQNDKDLKNSKEDCLKFLKHVQLITGKTPIIYTGLALAKFLQMDSRFAEFPLWLAVYRSKNNPPIPPSPWNTFFAWQYSDKEKIAGCGNADASIYNKKMDLFNLGKK
jgi:lysozyme